MMPPSRDKSLLLNPAAACFMVTVIHYQHFFFLAQDV